MFCIAFLWIFMLAATAVAAMNHIWTICSCCHKTKRWNSVEANSLFLKKYIWIFSLHKKGRTVGPNVRLWDIANFLVSSIRWQSILEFDCVQYIFITFWFKILVPDFLDIFKNFYLLKLPYKDSKNIIWILYLEALF